jgi:hypothetical protein
MTDVEIREGLATGALSVVNADHLRRLISRNDERQTELAALRARVKALEGALVETREALECVANPRPQLVEEQAHWNLLRKKAWYVLAKHAALAPTEPQEKETKG